MEYTVGQEIHIGHNVSGIIYYVNETQITILNWDRTTKTYYKDFLNKVSQLEKEYFFLSDEVVDSLKDIYNEAIELNGLILKFNSAI